MTDLTTDNALDAQQTALSGMSSADTRLAQITHALQTALSGQDRGQIAQLQPILLQHLSVSPQQRHVPLAMGLQLLQLGTQALNLAAGDVQVAKLSYPVSEC